MRHFARYAFTALSVVSLLFCVAACGLWAWSYHGPREGRVWTVYESMGARYRVRCVRGSLMVRLPAPGPSSSKGQALVAQLRNDQVHVLSELRTVWIEPDIHASAVFWEVDPTGTPLEPLMKAPFSDTARPLLKTLDDPGAFAAAHIALTRGAPTSTEVDFLPSRIACEGLRMVVHDPLSIQSGVDVVPGQQAKIRDYWYEKLERPGPEIPWGAVAAAGLVLPAAWGLVRAMAASRAAARYRSGLCLNCGYSLRGNTSGVCPECGTPVPSWAVPK